MEVIERRELCLYYKQKESHYLIIARETKREWVHNEAAEAKQMLLEIQKRLGKLCC